MEIVLGTDAAIFQETHRKKLETVRERKRGKRDQVMMITMLSVIIGIQIVILMAARYEVLPEEKNLSGNITSDMPKDKSSEISGVLKPFYKAGMLIAKHIYRHKGFLKDKENLQLLDPSRNGEEKILWFIAEKTALSFLVLFAGCIFALLTEIKDQGSGILQDGNRLGRQEYDEGKYTAYLTARIGEEADGESGFVRDMEITVEERQYTEEEIREMLPEFYEDLEKAVLGDNETADMVCKEISLVESLESYPFQIKWNSSNEQVINRYGIFGEDISEQGELITLTAEITYKGHMEIYSFPLMVYPMKISREEQVVRDLWDRIEEILNLSSEEGEIILPDEVDGITVVWQEQKKQNALILIALVICSSAAIFWGQSNELNRKIIDRKDQMIMDYPEVISKMTLLIGAGMTVRGAWKKIATDYRQRRDKEHFSRYIYEEMLFTLYEMESGIGELEAYQHFANRSHVQRYVKFVALLEQNVKLGAKGFLSELKREVKDAFEERKSTAKQLGETAGSKLMLPMFLMLGIVMVVIMVPSFLSIGM